MNPSGKKWERGRSRHSRVPQPWGVSMGPPQPCGLSAHVQYHSIFLAVPIKTCTDKSSSHFRFHRSLASGTVATWPFAIAAGPNVSNFLPTQGAPREADPAAPDGSLAGRYRVRNRALFCAALRSDVRSAPDSPARDAAMCGSRLPKHFGPPTYRAHGAGCPSVVAIRPGDARGGGGSDDGLRQYWRVTRSG